jgi:hypothetical protein
MPGLFQLVHTLRCCVAIVLTCCSTNLVYAQLDYPRASTTGSSSLWGLLTGSDSRTVVGSGRRVNAGGQSVSTTPHPAVARVVVAEKRGASLGSGTLIARTATHGYVITNWHVVRDAKQSVLLVFPNDQQVQGRILKVDQDWDLAVVETPPLAIEPLKLCDKVPTLGEQLWIAGYGGGDFLLQTGTCSQFLAPYPNWPHELVELTAAARQGDSGGPMLNANCELIGVLFGQGDGYTIGAFGGRVLKFLEGVTIQDADRPLALSALARNGSTPTPTTLAVSQSQQLQLAADRGQQSAVDRERYWSPSNNPGKLPAPLPATVAGDLSTTQLKSQLIMPDSPFDQPLNSPVASKFAARETVPAATLNLSIPATPKPLLGSNFVQTTNEIVPTQTASTFSATTNTITNASNISTSTQSDQLSTKPVAIPTASATSAQENVLTWEELAGRTTWDQTKSILWFVGGALVFFKVCGWLTRTGSGTDVTADSGTATEEELALFRDLDDDDEEDDDDELWDDDNDEDDD